MNFRGQKKSPRLSHSPLLEVNRTGSLLIVKSNSSNPPKDAQEQARAQRLPGSSKIHTEGDFTPFVSSVSTSTYSFSTGPATETSLFSFQTFSPDLSTPPPSFPFFPPPLFFPDDSLSHSLSLPQTACMDVYAAFRSNRKFWLLHQNYGFTTLAKSHDLLLH